MKIKNIMFSGVMAAILTSVCGAASAATVDLVTKGYVDKAVATKQADLGLTAEGLQAIQTEAGKVTGIAQRVEALEGDIGEMPVDGFTINGNTVNTIVGAINALDTKVASSEDVSDLKELVTNSETGLQKQLADVKNLVGDTSVESQIQDATAGMVSEGELNTTLADYATDEEVKNLVGEIPVATQIQDATAGMITESNMTEKLSGYATDSELQAVSNVANAALTKDVADTLYDAKNAAATVKSEIAAENYISGNGEAGTYLVTKDGNGGVTWNAVVIVDEEGKNAITGQTIEQPLPDAGE